MNEELLSIKGVQPTAFFENRSGKLFQKIDVLIESAKRTRANLTVRLPSQVQNILLGVIKTGAERYAIYLPEITAPVKAEFCLSVGETILDKKRVVLRPQKHYRVHLLHYAHHDLGYTDLPSNVLKEYDGFYDKVIEYCERTNRYPEDAKFRYVVEQAWSLQHFIRNRPGEVVKKLMKYAKAGRVEITALYGNLTTELCGTEALIRALYPSFEMKRKYGVHICAAQLNDIPGVTWGMAKILANSGIKCFCLGFPRWYFSKDNIRPFWDKDQVINLSVPGAYIWKSQDGKEILLWYDLHGAGEIFMWNLNQVEACLADRLEQLRLHEYPFSVVGYTVRGAERDNAPPSMNISTLTRQWNEKWAFPRLVVSTRDLFLQEFEKQSKGKLRVFSGELPNTDYNIGAISTAKETGINRITHDVICAAEKFATIASFAADYRYPRETIDECYENVLAYDDHCWSLHSTAGQGSDGNWNEKRVFAYRGAALAHDIVVKSINRIADNVKLRDDAYHVVVFNSLARKRSDIVRVPFAEYPPCGFPLHPQRSEDGTFVTMFPGSAVGREVISPPVEILDNGFELIDAETKKSVPYQIVELKDPYAPVPYASERYGIGTTQKADRFEIVFQANNVPSMGYRTYKIVPRAEPPRFESSISIRKNILENRFYMITLDPKTGLIAGIYDKELRRELVDKRAAHGFNQLIARDPATWKVVTQRMAVVGKGESGPVYGSLTVRTKTMGCPEVGSEIILYDTIKRIDISNRILRDSTPLLELYYAFPFKVLNPKFRYDGVGSTVEPIKDQFPGSNTDYYSIQNWASVGNRDIAIGLSSIEAPVVEFGGLWPGYVSGAHHRVAPMGYGHEFVRKFDKGYIYSYIMNNNFKTNFRATQVSDCLFRYSITSRKGGRTLTEPDPCGRRVHNPLMPVCVKGHQKRTFGSSKSFCKLDRQNVIMLALKRAEDKRGFIVRLQETEGKDCVVKLFLPLLEIAVAYLTNLVEEDEKKIACTKHSVRVPIKRFGFATVRVTIKLSAQVEGNWTG